jgi:cytochrome P450
MFVHLAEHPAARQQLVDHPETVAAVVEELLRWETPVMGGARVATQDTEVGGLAVEAGEQVMVLFGAANVDATEFPCPDQLDWDRATNRHLAFGGGIHRCLGSHLARIELRTALTEWHRRIPEYSVRAGAELQFTAGIRTLAAFPMVLGSS